MPSSVYVHIPFCKKKCNYCSFVSFEDLSFQDDYVKALLKEIEHYYKGEKLRTLYFGGGTPSLLSEDNFKRLLNSFNFEKNTEVTTEINPDSATLQYLKALNEIGINRLSIGIQSFDDEILKNIGRLHDSKTAFNAIKDARNAGFENISLDFIYGLPEQTLENFQNTLETAITLNPQHISLYGLKIEDGSKFAKKKPANLADEDLQADMFLCTAQIMRNYEHYEFSNFAQKGFESKHNLNYWDNNEYYGFGIAAHGYVDGFRYSNLLHPQQYLDKPTLKMESHKLSQNEKLEEEIFLGFRKCCGIETKKINQTYSIDFDKKYEKPILKYLQTGHLIKTTTGYKLSEEGILLSNNILCEFLE